MIVEFFGHHCAGKTTIIKSLAMREDPILNGVIFEKDVERAIFSQHFSRRGVAGRILAKLVEKSESVFRLISNDRVYPGALNCDSVEDSLSSVSRILFVHRQRDRFLPSDLSQEFHLIKAISLRRALYVYDIQERIILDESLLHRIFFASLVDENSFQFAELCLKVAPLPAVAIHVHETPAVILERIYQRRRNLADLYSTAGVPEKAVELSQYIRDFLVAKGVPVLSVQPTICPCADEIVARFISMNLDANEC